MIFRHCLPQSLQNTMVDMRPSMKFIDRDAALVKLMASQRPSSVRLPAPPDVHILQWLMCLQPLGLSPQGQCHRTGEMVFVSFFGERPRIVDANTSKPREVDIFQRVPRASILIELMSPGTRPPSSPKMPRSRVRQFAPCGTGRGRQNPSPLSQNRLAWPLWSQPGT